MSFELFVEQVLSALASEAARGPTSDSGEQVIQPPVLSDEMNVLNGFRESTSPQNCQLIVNYY